MAGKCYDYYVKHGIATYTQRHAFNIQCYETICLVKFQLYGFCFVYLVINSAKMTSFHNKTNVILLHAK